MAELSADDCDDAAKYDRSLDLHRRIEALYPRVAEQRVYLRGLMRPDPAIPRVPGKSGGVMIDPIVCALAIKAATTKRAVVTLCEQGDGDNALVLTRVLLENACLLEWLIRGPRPRRLEAYAMFMSVVHEHIVALVERFRDRFVAAGADSQLTSDPYHRAVAEHVFGNPNNDRPTWKFGESESGERRKRKRKAKGIQVTVKEMFEEIAEGGRDSFEHEVLYGSLGSDMVHSGPFSLAHGVATLLKESTCFLGPLPRADTRIIALAISNTAMLLVLDSLNEYSGLGLENDIAALKQESQRDPAKEARDGGE